MRIWKLKSIILYLFMGLFLLVSFKQSQESPYKAVYLDDLKSVQTEIHALMTALKYHTNYSIEAKQKIAERIHQCRLKLKNADFWFRYLEPIAYKRINGPLPVEWENEVFEKFEKPYKRVGAGLTLAELYLDKSEVQIDTLIKIISTGYEASEIFGHDSITLFLKKHHHFFLANRLFLLNLAAIYTTGFECPDPDRIIPELQSMILHVNDIYKSYNQTYPDFKIKANYLTLYENLLVFVNLQSNDRNRFNHFVFIKDFVNPLFAINQEMIRSYKIISESYNDYSLNNKVHSIFDKFLYEAQDIKGVYRGIRNDSMLNEIQAVGRLLFYDPLVSENNKRSCISCHIPKQFFADTSATTNLQFDQKQSLARNTPSLINASSNHLMMLDGKHINLLDQLKDVSSNPQELASNEVQILNKILSCKTYKAKFKNFAKWTSSKRITFDHVASAIILYYSQFSNYYAAFDEAMNNQLVLDQQVIEGFNLFMGKAACGTCHFVPFFNGVKPPYVGSEFEVLGVPQSKSFEVISSDLGRYRINPATETHRAFRTGNLKNILKTKPFMHNGVFKSIEEVIEFYDHGGGIGKGLQIDNQTLSSDSLKLDDFEKIKLIKFMEALTEKIIFDEPPLNLPISKIKELNKRKVGGEY